MSEKEFFHFVPYSSRAPLTSTSKLYFHLAILCFSFQNHFFHSCKALHGTDAVMIVGDVSLDDHIHSWYVCNLRLQEKSLQHLAVDHITGVNTNMGPIQSRPAATPD
jgi:hypothetical protein